MMIIRLVKMVGRMITVANIEKVTIETLVITVIVVTVVVVVVVVVAAIIVLALRVNIVARVVIIAIVIDNWNTGRKSNNTSKSSSSSSSSNNNCNSISSSSSSSIVAVTIRTISFHPFDLTIYPMCSRHRYQETLLHYMHSCIVTLEKVHAHSPPDSNKTRRAHRNGL